MPAVGTAAQAAQAADPSETCVLLNKQQKGKARTWLDSDPADLLIVVLVSSELGLAMLRWSEYVASDRWQIGAWARAARGECNSRLFTAAGGLVHRLHTRVTSSTHVGGFGHSCMIPCFLPIPGLVGPCPPLSTLWGILHLCCSPAHICGHDPHDMFHPHGLHAIHVHPGIMHVHHQCARHP